jgi:hypothetical protein
MMAALIKCSDTHGVELQGGQERMSEYVDTLVSQGGFRAENREMRATRCKSPG